MKLISWNIQWCRGCDGRVDPARIGRVASEMADFDVLCLQEIAHNYPDLAGSAGENQYEAAGQQAAPFPAKEGPFRTLPRPASGVLTADFNFPPEDALHARLQSPLAPGVPAYRDAWQLSHPGKPHAPTIGVHDKLQWPG